MAAKRPSLADSTLADEWKCRIARELEKGEKFLWAGQPDPTMAMCRYLHMISAVMLFFLLVLGGVTWLSWDGIRQGQLGSTVLPGGLLLVVMGLPSLVFWQRRRARRTCYVLSSRRALVFQPNLFGKLRVTSYLPQQLRNARFKRSWLFGPNAGDWIFCQQFSKRVTHYVDEGRTEVARGVKSYGFLMLRNALEIRKLLHAVAERE